MHPLSSDGSVTIEFTIRISIKMCIKKTNDACYKKGYYDIINLAETNWIHFLKSMCLH